ncbi:MAG: 4Fe-4S binding protein [Syntrophobacteraceae bacterium]
MRIVTARRISQLFFFLLFIWFCIVASFGTNWRQLRGWPVNWFLQLDPLVALATVITTGTLYAGLLWALATLVLTIVLGRFFCSWVCPFGSIHHFVGYLGKRGKPLAKQVSCNQYHQSQSIKYYLLLFLLSAASGALISRAIRTAFASPLVLGTAIALTVLFAALTMFKLRGKTFRSTGILLLLFGIWVLPAFLFSVSPIIGASLQTGLLDPIPLVYRSFNLILLPLFDAGVQKLSATRRYYDGVWLIGIIFFSAVLLNLKIPRFYCRFVCPLGALFGVLGRFALWRIGKTRDECTQCKLCEAGCEGGCNPAGTLHLPECLLCMNCRDDCRHDLIAYRTRPSESGEIDSPDVSRRGLVLTMLSGIAVIPVLRIEGGMAQNWNPALVRPPGALPEDQFLSRCIKCGQCMRICPTNIIHPSGAATGVEGLWTPNLNFRIGSSGCQLNCIACSHVCPTAAIRPISLDEKLGRAQFAAAGPIRIGTAFVDRGRCLPWAMDRPCLVCQENCPVSPKAIFVKEYFSTVRGSVLTVKKADALNIELEGSPLKPGGFATGDFYLKTGPEPRSIRKLIAMNSDRSVTIREGDAFDSPPAVGSTVEIQVRLQQPHVDLERCIGCGVCEHECPVNGRRAIRVTAENESRSRKHSLLL